MTRPHEASIAPFYTEEDSPGDKETARSAQDPGPLPTPQVGIFSCGLWGWGLCPSQSESSSRDCPPDPWAHRGRTPTGQTPGPRELRMRPRQGAEPGPRQACPPLRPLPWPRAPGLLPSSPPALCPQAFFPSSPGPFPNSAPPPHQDLPLSWSRAPPPHKAPPLHPPDSAPLPAHQPHQAPAPPLTRPAAHLPAAG